MIAGRLTTNQRWSLDFVADASLGGRRFRILAIVDDFTREALALVVDTSIGGWRLASSGVSTAGSATSA